MRKILVVMGCNQQTLCFKRHPCCWFEKISWFYFLHNIVYTFRTAPVVVRSGSAEFWYVLVMVICCQVWVLHGYFWNIKWQTCSTLLFNKSIELVGVNDRSLRSTRSGLHSWNRLIYIVGLARCHVSSFLHLISNLFGFYLDSVAFFGSFSLGSTDPLFLILRTLWFCSFSLSLKDL